MKAKYKAGDLLYIGVDTYMFITGVELIDKDSGLLFYRMYSLKYPEAEVLRECVMIEDIVKMAMR